MHMKIAAFVCVFGAAAAADAATLRPMSQIDAPVVRLADLFDDAGALGARVLGPGPAPGGQLVVEAAQLGAIARQFGVDWRPVTGLERAILQRTGEPVAREAVLGALRAALAGAGADADAEIEATAFSPPIAPPRTSVQTAVTQLDWDRAGGRFTALIAVAAPGMETATIRLSGRVLPTTEVVVATRRLEAGDVLRPEDVTTARVRALLVHTEVVRDRAEAAGLTVRRPIPPGQPLAAADVFRAPLVQRRAVVMIELETPGLSLTAQGLAMEAGARGEHIRVLNPASRAVIEAEVTGEGRVRAIPGTSPLVPAGRGPQGAVQGVAP